MLVHVAPPPSDGLSRPDRADSSEADASQPSSHFEFTPFNPVSSFNLPAACDSSLLTPVSSSASPPLFSESKHGAGSISAQTSPFSTPGRPVTPQQKMYWPSQYTASGQGCSPMSLHNDSGIGKQPPHGGYELYVTGEPTPERCPGSPMSTIHQSPFFSPSYHLVPSIESESSPPLSDYYMPLHDANVNPNNLVMGGQQPNRHLSPTSSYLKPSPNIGHQRRASAQEMGIMSDVFTIPKQRGGYRVNKKTPRARSRSEQISSRVLKDINETVAESAAQQQQKNEQMTDAPQVQPMQPATESEMPLLKDDTPPEEKLLFELRLRHDSIKGRAMWDAILVDYMEITGKHIEKAALQMKFFRSKSKWVIWTPGYMQALEEAIEEVERERYKEILERFRKRIGKNIIDFTAGNIEAKMVELGLEEDLYIEKSKHFVRRRKKVTEQRRRASGSSKDSDSKEKEDSRRPSCAESVNSTPFMPDQADEILDQIGHRGFAVMHVDSPESEDEANTANADDETHLSLRSHNNAQRLCEQSQKMARQACDDMIGLASPFNNPHPFFTHQDLAAAS